MDYSKYPDLRANNNTLVGYGLQRRLRQIEGLLRVILDLGKLKDLRVLDFGCADDITLKYLLSKFGKIFEKGLGIDIFPFGVPNNMDSEGLRFFKLDLFNKFPYPFSDSSCNIVISSAFFKHHPNPKLFLNEIWRILEEEGYLLLLDPCPWVIKVGIWLKYFEKRYCPNIWDKNSIKLNVHEGNLNYRFKEIFYEKYWVAPNKFLFDLGVENLFPNKIINIFGLHQSLVLRKVEST